MGGGRGRRGGEGGVERGGGACAVRLGTSTGGGALALDLHLALDHRGALGGLEVVLDGGATVLLLLLLLLLLGEVGLDDAGEARAGRVELLLGLGALFVREVVPAEDAFEARDAALEGLDDLVRLLLGGALGGGGLLLLGRGRLLLLMLLLLGVEGGLMGLGLSLSLSLSLGLGLLLLLELEVLLLLEVLLVLDELGLHRGLLLGVLGVLGRVRLLVGLRLDCGRKREVSPAVQIEGAEQKPSAREG